MNIFENTKESKIVELLEKAGHQAFFVGGCVRDYLIHKNFVNENDSTSTSKFEDIDIATSASPEESKQALYEEFSEFNLVGERFGVLMVEDVEIAQFRSEMYTSENLGKPEVQPEDSAEQDASRRDFTMNALYMNHKGEIFDFNNGLKDIESKLVRAVGNAEDRFSEDPSRILRMFYLASRFGFSIESETLKAAQSKKGLIKEIPDALVGKIVKKVLSQNKLSQFLFMLNEADLLETVFPEFKHTLNKKQNPQYHNSDVFGHTLRVIEHVQENHPKNKLLLMAAWMHDIAKGLEGIRAIDEEGKISDLGHEEAGAPLAEKLCLRLQFGKTFAEEVKFLVRWHGIRFYKGFKLRSYLKVGRKIAKNCKDKEQMLTRSSHLIELMQADAAGFDPEFEKEVLENLNSCKEKFLNIIQEEKFFVKELFLTGKDVIALWENKSNIKHTGEVLEQLLLARSANKEVEQKAAERIVKEIESKVIAV